MILLGTYLWTAFIASTHTNHSRRLLQVVWVLRNCTGERGRTIDRSIRMSAPVMEFLIHNPPFLLSLAPYRAAVAALTVSLLFWAVLFPAIGRTSLVDVHCHAVNSLIVLVDLTVTHVPYYLKHGWMPFAYLLTYLLFSIIYWLDGGTDPAGDHYIYPPLDYDKPSEAAGLVLLVVGVVLPAIHVSLFFYNRFLFRKGFFGWAPSLSAASALSASPSRGGRASDRMPLLPN